MLKELLLPAIVGALFGGGSVGAGIKFWADHTYTHKDDHEHEHVAMVAEFGQSLRQSSDQSRIYVLQDQIRAIKQRAAREDRPLTLIDLDDIDELNTQIDNLKGW